MKKRDIFNMLLDSLIFLVVEYILGCAIYSFQHNPLFIIFFASDMYICEKHLSYLKNLFSKKSNAYIFFFLTVLVLFLLFCTIGLFPITPELTKGGF